MSSATVLKSCGHTGHIGTCPACQRAMIARHNAQLLTAIALRPHPGSKP